MAHSRKFQGFDQGLGHYILIASAVCDHLTDLLVDSTFNFEN